MPELTLVPGSLATPMAWSDPSVLPWTIQCWDLMWQSDGHFAVGHVAHYHGHGEAPEGQNWKAFCAGPGESKLSGWHATAEAAKAAVEEHIAAQVERHLNGVEL